MIKNIYVIEVFDNEGNLRFRGFARNKKTANKIAKKLEKRNEQVAEFEENGVVLETNIRLLSKWEWQWIDMNWVE